MLDPACGDGQLLEAVVNALPPEMRSKIELVGYELDPIALSNASNRLDSLKVATDVRRANFLDIYDADTGGGLFAGEVPTRETFDVIISNPHMSARRCLGQIKRSSWHNGSA